MPQDISYVEAHATSTQLGDATELHAIMDVMGRSLPAGKKIPVGSVKANIGHTLEAAGLAGMLKVLLMLEHDLIPQQVNINSLTDKFPWKDSPFYVSQKNLPWKKLKNGSSRKAAVNAFGIGGLNAHVVIEEYLTSENQFLSENLTSPKDVSDSSLPIPIVPIAVVGMSCLLPGISCPEDMANVSTTGQSCCQPVPTDRWDALFSGKSRPHRGVLANYAYRWEKHRIPPLHIKRGNPLQFMILDAVGTALQSVDLEKISQDMIGVVVGTPFESDFDNSLQMGIRLPEFYRQLEEQLTECGWSCTQIQNLRENYRRLFLERLPALLDDSGSFTLSTLASQITKIHDFKGGAVTLNAGSCSSMASLQAAVNMLRCRDNDMVICVGAGRNIGRMSLAQNLHYPQAEGVIVFLLKRYDDAMRDGDLIHAVIDAVECSTISEVGKKIAGNPIFGNNATSGFWENDDFFLIGNDVEKMVKNTPPFEQVGLIPGVSGMFSLLNAICAMKESPKSTNALVFNFDDSDSVYTTSLRSVSACALNPFRFSAKEQGMSRRICGFDEAEDCQPYQLRHKNITTESTHKKTDELLSGKYLSTVISKKNCSSRHNVFPRGIHFAGTQWYEGVSLHAGSMFIPQNKPFLYETPVPYVQIQNGQGKIPSVQIVIPGIEGAIAGINAFGLSISGIQNGRLENMKLHLQKDFFNFRLVSRLLSESQTVFEALQLLNELRDLPEHTYCLLESRTEQPALIECHEDNIRSELRRELVYSPDSFVSMNDASCVDYPSQEHFLDILQRKGIPTIDECRCYLRELCKNDGQPYHDSGVFRESQFKSVEISREEMGADQRIHELNDDKAAQSYRQRYRTVSWMIIPFYDVIYYYHSAMDGQYESVRISRFLPEFQLSKASHSSYHTLTEKHCDSLPSTTRFP